MLRSSMLGQISNMSLRYSYALLNVRLMRNSQIPVVRLFSAFSANSVQPTPKNGKSINWTVPPQTTFVFPSRFFCKKASDSDAQKVEPEVNADEKPDNKIPLRFFPYVTSFLSEMNKMTSNPTKKNIREAKMLNEIANMEPLKDMVKMIDPYIAPLLADVAHPKYGLFQRELPVDVAMEVLCHTYGVNLKEKWGMTAVEYLVTVTKKDPDDDFDCRKKYEMDQAMATLMFNFMTPSGSRWFSDEEIKTFYENMAILARENKTYYDEHKTEQPFGVCDRYAEADMGPIKRVFRENLAHFEGRDIMNNLDDLRYFVESEYGFEILFSWADLADEGRLFEVTHCKPVEEEEEDQ